MKIKANELSDELSEYFQTCPVSELVDFYNKIFIFKENVSLEDVEDD